ncbi:ankyrin repeat domain-containing protein [Flavobacterium sp.]|uniref:ankyrin repeat domain-containing protein n=1 Tax=Flavobacterium sp. TaxID=239 RepID=UPI003750B2A8
MKRIFTLFVCLLFSLGFSQEKLNVFDIGRKGTVEQAKEILKTNIKAFNVVNDEGYSPLVLACYRGNNEVAKFLIENGSDINGNSKMGTPLMASIVKGNNEIAKLLIENKADVNSTDANGTTALIYATNFKNYEIVSLLIKADADYNKEDNRGNSALEYAILLNDDKLIETLKNKKL